MSSGTDPADSSARARLHRVVAVALPDVVAFDLSIAAQVFGHRDERERYTFTVSAEHPGPVTSTTGFTINAPAGLEAPPDAAPGSRLDLHGRPRHRRLRAGSTPMWQRRGSGGVTGTIRR